MHPFSTSVKSALEIQNWCLSFSLCFYRSLASGSQWDFGIRKILEPTPVPFYETLGPFDFSPVLPKLFLPPLGKTQGQWPFLFEKEERPFAVPWRWLNSQALCLDKIMRNTEKPLLSLSGYGKLLGVYEMIWGSESFLAVSPLLPSTCWTTTIHPGLAPKGNQRQPERKPPRNLSCNNRTVWGDGQWI